jgi:hypothetical protein
VNTAEWSKKCSVVLQNEVLPRAKKLGISLDEFADANALSALARLEYDGIITRRTLREILDERVKIIQNDKLRTD